MLDVEVDGVEVEAVASFEPAEGLSQPDEVLVALQDHHEGELVGHQVLSHHPVAVLALPALGVGLQLFFLHSLVDLVVVHSDGLDVDLGLLLQDEGLGVDVPPVASLVLDEVAHKLYKVDLEVGLHELGNVSDIPNGLLEVLVARALHCVEGFRHFGVDHKFAHFIDFFCGSVGIIRTQNPALVAAVSSPASSHN